MAKVIVCNLMSLDGYFEGPGKDVMALFAYRETYPTDESFDRYNAERLRAASTLLLERTSYEGFRSYWPSVAGDPDATPANQEVSRLNNAIDKVVVSDSLAPDPAAAWHENTRILRRADAHQQIAGLKRQAGKDILIFGSRTLWNDLLANGLMDELHLLIAPVVLGAGTPLFAAPPPASLRLVDTQTWDGAGIALVRYAARPQIA